MPDSFLKGADQVVNLDLAVEDLHERLKAGKIYAPEKVPRALENFFKQENLSTLRELALREVAESLDRATASQQARAGEEAQARAAAGDGCWWRCPATRRARPRCCAGARAWRAGSTPTGSSSTSRRRARPRTSSTPRRSATCWPTSRRPGSWAPRWCACARKDPVEALLDFARSHGVGHIMVGRSHQPWWKQLLGLRSDVRLLREGGGLRHPRRLLRAASRGAPPMTLRGRLLLAQAPLALALVLVGVVAVRHPGAAGALRAADPPGQLPQRAGHAADDRAAGAHGQRRALHRRG